MSDILSDAYRPLEINPTYGAGGGTYGGRGGGRIFLYSKQIVTVYPFGSLLAEGSTSTVNGFGAGSGGSVLIIADQVYNNGKISVNGGDATTDGGAGGGGRVAFLVIFSHFVFFLFLI
jgi:hypothetical protein